MRLAISAQEKYLHAALDPRFGRCFYFFVIDLKTNNMEAISNPGRDMLGGAGVHAAQSLVNIGINKLVTGKIGPNAMHILKKNNITVYHTTAKSIAEALVMFKDQQLTELTEASVEPQTGLLNSSKNIL